MKLSTAASLVCFAAMTTLGAGSAIAANASAEALHTWHESLKNSPPGHEGCFQANYPSTDWQEEPCQPAPAYRSNPHFAGLETVGNGNDYSATTSALTESATGSFPAESGVTSASNGGYTLQLNTNIGSSSPACASYGYSSCQTWEQFIYSSNYPGSAGTGVSGAQAFIQNWMFIPRGKRCPSGWTSYKTSSYSGCYKNSLGVSAPAVALMNLSSAQLSGVAAANGLDTVTYTYQGTAHAVSQSAGTLAIGYTWKNSEFNVVGNGGGSGATFNTGSSLTVKVGVNDGTTNAPACTGPTNGGTTGETNNLTLHACTAVGGTSPFIEFSESN